MRRLGVALAIGWTCGCTAAAPVVAAAPAGAPGRVRVHYPAGACGGELELEVFDRASGAWRAHPEHPRLPPGACAWEWPGGLLNEIRVRCADPAGARPPSEWVVGAEVAPAQATCPGDATE